VNLGMTASGCGCGWSSWPGGVGRVAAAGRWQVRW